MDTFSEVDNIDIPEATGTTSLGADKPLTTLQRKASKQYISTLPKVNTIPDGDGITQAEVKAGWRQMSGEVKQVQAELDSNDFANAFKANLGGITGDIYRVATQKSGSEKVDPNYDVGKNRAMFHSKYPIEHWDAFERLRNQSEEDALIARLDAKAERERVSGRSIAGTLAAGIFTDPLTLLTGGPILKGALWAGRANKWGKAGTLAAGAVAEGGMYAGTEAALQKGEFGNVYDPVAVGKTFAVASALHFGVGHLLTSKAHFEANGVAPLPPVAQFTEDHPAVLAEGSHMVLKAQQELSRFYQLRSQELDVGKAPELPVQRIFPESSYPLPKQENAPESAAVDAGAAANTGRADILEGNIIMSRSEQINDAAEIYTRADEANRELLGKYAYEWLDTPVGKMQAAFSNTLQGLSSKSPIVRAVAQTLGADPTGITRAVERATAYDKSIYNNIMRKHYADVHDEYRGWLKRNGKGGYVDYATGRHEAEFNTALRAEMEARWNTKDLDPAEMHALDEARWATTAPEVKRAADALDRGNQAALDLMKRHNVLGADGLSDISRGYIPRRMDGKKLQDLHRADKAAYDRLATALGDRYYKSFTDAQHALMAAGEKDIKLISKEKAHTIAKGSMERAINRASGMDGSTIGLLDRAARDEIKAILESKDMDYADIEHTFKLLDKRLGTRTGSNRLKGRMSVDIATPLDDGTSLLSYFDNDLNRLTSSYAEEMSGRIALARQGISSDNDFENILNAVKNENKSADVAKDIQLLRDMHSQLLGRPLQNQGQNKLVQFLTQLNPLQTLGQVGVAQATESSLSVARMGIGAALKAIPVAAKLVLGIRHNAVSESDKALLKSIEAWMGPVGEHWRTHRPSTDVMERLNANGEFSHMADRLMKAGQHINGFVSLMHQIMESQLKIVAIEGSRTFAKEIKAGVLTKRIADAGWNEHSMQAIKRELDAHAVFRDGELYDLQLHRWNPDNADDFTRNLERLSGQLLQRDFAGETASWMHTDMGRMLLSLRGYSVKAFNKQLIRNVQIGDAVAAQALVYGMAFSTLGYSAKTYLMAQGREDKEQFLEDRMSGDAFVQGAVGYMALGAFAPEIVRPLASWYGEGSTDAGTIRSGGNAVVAAIPGLAPLARILTDVDNIGGATIGDRDFGSKQVRHLVQSTLGNSFPVALAVNAATDDSQ